ncbi:30S ribosomal protein S9 [candidate division WOR-1 bacterium RIFOXYA12_FULL_43_27]|uniref:30S ribosomal protein S9 n=1 Tax=candidate division WOR-1 bacterium RIFOXYC2_FULL_46_14 TaxID=1802587 RepID=A0A1F4U6I6_UNCSA|nr:MAG: 30S ribosomal protein S9 [candidate division WOR-1 bacterium RIFOXYA12_FULL_43_27]OGC20941.1 MAG: 30S ribosomal protein S9 [candidate division WOR-1 bacterium RIFOXYB2_FULL_46_45]OGC32299.1 MAG: 30S ribosomal protein S9 [candidate division WOR-1 bacterium RIFOXYA2_FULL_46_56]OGC40497.1 MAG: 30S ribosomal protein S9 [candidate division WOR-1 bacterium RIFOXYC2_FULL_46_14]
MFYGTGRRKRAIARVHLVPGDGARIVNGKELKEYFCGREILLKLVEVPFNAVSAPAFNLKAEVYGGGVPSQADAIRMGVARALVDFNPDFRKILRSLDLLKRDPREKERKKAGLKRARKAFQFTKR